MIYLCRRAHFNAAHRLEVPGWSEEKNQEVFGHCASPNWHGHNFILYVTIKGEPDPETGMLMDVRDLSKVIEEKVVSKLDHKNLNLDVDFLQGQNPSTENLAIGIWKQLEPEFPSNPRLHQVRIYETENHYVDYFGNDQ